jgi:hypothetical protein
MLSMVLVSIQKMPQYLDNISERGHLGSYSTFYTPLTIHLRISQADLSFACVSETEEDESQLDLLSRPKVFGNMTLNFDAQHPLRLYLRHR